MSGADGSTTFTDRTGRHTLTAAGNAQVDTDLPPPGQSSSALFDGSGDTITIADSADWNFGSGDFTVEYFSQHRTSATGAAITQYSASGGNRAWAMFEGSALAFFYTSDGGTDQSLSWTNTEEAQWYHRAVSRVGNTLYLSYGGAIVATRDVTGVAFRNSARPLVIGGNNNGSTAQYDGKVANVRITKGVGRYGNPGFTPPSAPFATGSSDPYWSNVKLCVEFSGANGSTSFTDQSPSGHTLTASGNAQISTADSPSWQSSALNLDGSGDFVTIADSADWDFGTDDFTVEYYAKHDTTVVDALIAQYGTTGNDRGWGFFEGNSLEFYYSLTGSDDVGTTSTIIMPPPRWSHKAISRVGNTLYLCYDGIVRATKDVTGLTMFDSNRQVAIGANGEGTTAFYTGRIANVRITKGTGRYSGSVNSSYTVPSVPYPVG
ncbi:hypothetical protein KIH45_06170 [Croceicoccus sp. 1NDH52]|nr:LamG domain-containing protein [Croceicoccus gelatinilyticus]MBS7669323.1 hypothetical protein [Croceicoccus gelatinilyticus]